MSFTKLGRIMRSAGRALVAPAIALVLSVGLFATGTLPIATPSQAATTQVAATADKHTVDLVAPGGAATATITDQTTTNQGTITVVKTTAIDLFWRVVPDTASNPLTVQPLPMVGNVVTIPWVPCGTSASYLIVSTDGVDMIYGTPVKVTYTADACAPAPTKVAIPSAPSVTDDPAVKGDAKYNLPADMAQLDWTQNADGSVTVTTKDGYVFTDGTTTKSFPAPVDKYTPPANPIVVGIPDRPVQVCDGTVPRYDTKGSVPWDDGGKAILIGSDKEQVAVILFNDDTNAVAVPVWGEAVFTDGTRMHPYGPSDKVCTVTPPPTTTTSPAPPTTQPTVEPTSTVTSPAPKPSSTTTTSAPAPKPSQSTTPGRPGKVDTDNGAMNGPSPFLPAGIVILVIAGLAMAALRYRRA